MISKALIAILLAIAGDNVVSAGQYTDAFNAAVTELHSTYASCPDGHFDEFFRWNANEGADFLETNPNRNFIFVQRWESQAYFTHRCPNFYFLQRFLTYYDSSKELGDDLKSECESRDWAGTGYGQKCVRETCTAHYDDCVVPIGKLMALAVVDFIEKQSETMAPTTSTPSASPSVSPASEDCIDQSKTAHDALFEAGELELASFTQSNVGTTAYYKYNVSSSYAHNCVTEGNGEYKELDFTASCSDGTTTQDIVVQGRPMCYGLDCESATNLKLLLDEYTLHPTEALAHKELGGVWECTLTEGATDGTIEAEGDICMQQSAAINETADITAIKNQIKPEFKHKPLFWKFGEKMEKEVWVESSYTSSLEIECENKGGTYVEETNFKVHCKKGDTNKAEYDVANFPMCIGTICDPDVKNAEIDTLLLFFTEEMSNVDEDLASTLVCELSGSVRASVGLILAGIAASAWYLF